MPNLVVYVPTSLWKRIEELGLADPKIEARKVARGALESWLSERSAVKPGDRASEDRRSSAEDAVAPRYSGRSESPPSYFPEREVKPDPKPERKK